MKQEDKISGTLTPQLLPRSRGYTRYSWHTHLAVVTTADCGTSSCAWDVHKVCVLGDDAVHVQQHQLYRLN